jgi:hypothetical protein
MPGVVVFADRLRLTALRRRADHFNRTNEFYPCAGGWEFGGGMQGERLKKTRHHGGFTQM